MTIINKKRYPTFDSCDESFVAALIIVNIRALLIPETQDIKATNQGEILDSLRSN